MSNLTSAAVLSPKRLGVAFIARALPAIVVALAITFSADHSAVVGLIAFLAFGFATAPILMMTALAVPLTGKTRVLTFVQAAATIGAAAIAATTLDMATDSLQLTIAIWAAVAGIAELLQGILSQEKGLAREWITLGVLGCLLAIVEVFPLTEVYAVGLFGAYAAIVGVYLVIAGVSFVMKKEES